ncbi:MAG TPA: YetF domain-containing protein [Blastocatellia bacterium]|nr:YetF domain-containing protein [Blastocatellia bacterium]
MDPKSWSDMFHLGLPVVEKILRPIIVYVFLIVGLRLAGKRELAQLNPFDLVVLLTLSNTVQNAIIGDDNSVSGGLIGAATLLAINYLVVRFLYNHQNLNRLVEGDTDVLIQEGRLRRENLKKELITMAELESAAHKQGFGSLEEVQTASLEPGGTISFVAKKPAPEDVRQRELTAKLDAITSELAALRAALTHGPQ